MPVSIRRAMVSAVLPWVTYARFAKKLGITPSSLFRLENGQQSITLGRLEQIARRLKCRLADVFPGEF